MPRWTRLSDATLSLDHALGSAYSVSEFINTLDYANQKSYEKNACSSVMSNAPLWLIARHDAVRIAEAAARIEEEFHPDMFDINMGCSARSVAGHWRGRG